MIAAAEWLDPNALESLEYIYDHLGRVLTPEEMTSISRVVPLDPGGVVLQSFLTKNEGKTGMVALKGFMFDGVAIHRGYVFTGHDPVTPIHQRARKTRTKRTRAKE